MAKIVFPNDIVLEETDEKGALPDAPTDVEAYQNATARVDQFLEKVADD